MNPELSRRAARAVNKLNLPLPERLRLAEAAEAAGQFEDLPDWAQEIILRAETGPHGRPFPPSTGPA